MPSLCHIVLDQLPGREAGKLCHCRQPSQQCPQSPWGSGDLWGACRPNTVMGHYGTYGTWYSWEAESSRESWQQSRV